MIFLTVILSLLYPARISNYPLFVDWETIAALAGLLMLTTGLKESGYFSYLSNKILKKAKDERKLVFFLILLSASLSTFLTNDITLFVVIPLTLAMKKWVKINVSKLIIFEVMSVNVGSALTPIGNPQNIFLWGKWNISFLMFIVKMFPLVILMLVILLILSRVVFPNKEINLSLHTENKKIRRNLFIFSMVLLIIFLFSLDINHPYPILLPIFLFYLIYRRDVLIKTDWLLLLIFILIFINFHVISTLPFVIKCVHTLDISSKGNVFLFSASISQLVSNVPASVFISKFSNRWLEIIYGVNVGGNGFVLASMANVIALRMSKTKNIWFHFHRYSIPYFIITLAIVYMIFNL